MRNLAVAGILLLSSSAMAAEKEISFSLVDMAIEQQNGAPHLVSVAFAKDGHLQLQSHGVIPVGSGGYNGVVRLVFDDGAITALLHLNRDEHGLTGQYTVFSGSDAYSGAHGQGSLRTLTGREAAASAQGVYQVRLQVTVPQLAMAIAQ
jgi:hypothetical protein